MRQAQILFFFIAICSFLSAQAGSMTQKEVDAEKAFIEAKQAALLGNFDDALTLFEALLAKSTGNDVLYYEIGRIYYAKEAIQDAERALEKAFDLNPNVAYAGLLGDVYQATGQYQKGADLYSNLAKMTARSSKALGSSYEHLRKQQALFLVKAQQLEKAIAVYNDLQKTFGVTADLSRKKHALYLGQGDTKKAEKELLGLIEAYPKALEYRHLLAGFYISQKQQKKAVAVHKEILRIEPADVKAQLALNSYDTSASQSSTEDGTLMKLISRTDVDLDLKIGKLLPMVQMVANKGNLAAAKDAQPLIEELVRVHPTDAKPLAILADLYFYSGQIDQAAKTYKKTIDLDDTVYAVWEQYLHALYLDGQSKELCAAAEDALDVFPNRPFVSFYNALGEANRGDFSEAESLLDQAIFIFNAAGRQEAKMATIYQGIVEDLAAGKLPSNDLLPQNEGPLSLYIQALNFVDKGNFETAADLLQPLNHDRNSNALVLELLGDVLLKTTGDNAQALEMYQRAKAAGGISKKLSKKILENKSN